MFEAVGLIFIALLVISVGKLIQFFNLPSLVTKILVVLISFAIAMYLSSGISDNTEWVLIFGLGGTMSAIGLYIYKDLEKEGFIGNKKTNSSKLKP